MAGGGDETADIPEPSEFARAPRSEGSAMSSEARVVAEPRDRLGLPPVLLGTHCGGGGCSCPTRLSLTPRVTDCCPPAGGTG